ncbi:MAG: S1/P1 nuclease [Acidobacteria bacterium]|nr:S1/P1 nuclease [Acidobacteriota bacterium]
MAHRFLKCALFSLLFCFVALPARGWDDVGHKITGYIAWQRMSPAAREEVIRILRKAPEDSHLSAFYMAYGPQSDDVRKREYFTMMPTWADIIRDRDFPVRQKKYHRSNWHYSDTFWRQVNGKAEIITDKEPGGQGLVKLVEFDKVLRDASVADPEKALAIAWFMHIGGDLHQPLHTSGRHTDREPNGDQGGNLFLLEPDGPPTGEYRYTLHWFWDSIVGRNIPFNDARSEQDYLDHVVRSMTHRYTFESVKDDLKLGDYPAWRQESFELAVSDVFSSDLARFKEPSDEYRRNAYRVSERRLVIAGYRLGETLEQIFGKK